MCDGTSRFGTQGQAFGTLDQERRPAAPSPSSVAEIAAKQNRKRNQEMRTHDHSIQRNDRPEKRMKTPPA
jgi:hypothetical protein